MFDAFYNRSGRLQSSDESKISNNIRHSSEKAKSERDMEMEADVDFVSFNGDLMKDEASDLRRFSLPKENKPKRGKAMLNTNFVEHYNRRYDDRGSRHSVVSPLADTVREIFENSEVGVVQEDNQHSFMEEINSFVMQEGLLARTSKKVPKGAG